MLAQVETYFIHSPDPDTPIEKTMEAVQEVHAAGGFEHVHSRSAIDRSCSIPHGFNANLCSQVRTFESQARAGE